MRRFLLDRFGSLPVELKRSKEIDKRSDRKEEKIGHELGVDKLLNLSLQSTYRRTKRRKKEERRRVYIHIDS